VRPAVDVQIAVWAKGEKVQEVVKEVRALDAQKVVITGLSPAELQEEKVSSIRWNRLSPFVFNEGWTKDPQIRYKWRSIRHE